MAVGPLAQVHVSVTDIDRSVAFYRDTLGIPFLFQLPGQSMALLSTGDMPLYLAVPESPESASRVLLHFPVDDINAEHARLAAAGVPVIDKPHVVHRDGTTELWMSFLREPDGHKIALIQERPAT